MTKLPISYNKAYRFFEKRLFRPEEKGIMFTKRYRYIIGAVKLYIIIYRSIIEAFRMYFKGEIMSIRDLLKLHT